MKTCHNELETVELEPRTIRTLEAARRFLARHTVLEDALIHELRTIQGEHVRDRASLSPRWIISPRNKLVIAPRSHTCCSPGGFFPCISYSRFWSCYGSSIVQYTTEQYSLSSSDVSRSNPDLPMYRQGEIPHMHQIKPSCRVRTSSLICHENRCNIGRAKGWLMAYPDHGVHRQSTTVYAGRHNTESIR